MTIQITLLGLGQIGSSIGLALAKHQDKIHRVGHDKSREAVNFAKENKAVDRVAITLSGAVKDAGIVILALPFHEIRPVLEHIAPDLKEDALVIDTSPIKTPVLAWVEELLPAGRHYLGYCPVIQSEYLLESEFGPQTARDDLFQGSLMGIVTGRKASTKAVNMGVSLAQLLGASPYFTDAAEADGLMSLTYLLPQITAAGLLKISQDGPGWREARKLAGRAYSLSTSSFGQDEVPEALAAMLAYNRENSNRLINDLIRFLVDLRDGEVFPDQDSLAGELIKLQQGRDLWLDDHKSGSWIDTPEPEYKRRGVLNQLLGFREPRDIEGQG